MPDIQKQAHKSALLEYIKKAEKSVRVIIENSEGQEKEDYKMLRRVLGNIVSSINN